MRYIDTTKQNIDETLGEWFANEARTPIRSIHFQVGYFSVAGLRPLAPILRGVRAGTTKLNAAIGSNDQSTGVDDVKSLLSLTGPLQNKSSLSIVTFDAGLFHPKVYAIKRQDKSKAIYIGSSNLSGPAFGGLNVEAGIILDDNDGDDTSSYKSIIGIIEQWSRCSLLGARPANNDTEVDQLLTAGYLRQKSIPQPGLSTASSPRKTSNPSGARRRPFKNWPRLAEETSKTTSVISGPTPTSPPVVLATQDTLVAEISGPGRWQQATFPKGTFPSFFGVPAGSGQTINLTYTDGIVRQTDTPAARTKSSSNFTLELSSLKGVAYPVGGRPIAVFHKTSPRSFSYCVLMPGQSGYAALLNLLSNEYTGPSTQIMRITTDLSTVQSWWPSLPLP